MPRAANKMLMKKRRGAGGGGGAGGSNTSGSNTTNKPKIIKIKPFVKPPALPPNYYDETSKELLQGTLDCVFATATTATTTTGDKENSGGNGGTLSLQNAYQQVVNLVSHQYGPQLYKDLIETMKFACQRYVLPEDDPIVQLSQSMTATTTNNNKNNNEGVTSSPGEGEEDARNVLQTIQTKYQKYVDYLLLCKHIFLPLDSSHVYNPTSGQVVSLLQQHVTSSAGSRSGSNGSNNAAGHGKQQPSSTKHHAAAAGAFA